MRKCFSMLLGAGMIALLTSCNFAANPNDGTFAKDGLNRYVDWSKGDVEKDPSVGGGTGGGTTTDSFWKGWQPFIGIQVWGPAEGWGQDPDIDMVSGTISATVVPIPDKTATMFPVFGAFDENGSDLIGTYDYSAVKKFSFKIKASRAGSTVVIGTYFTGSESKKTITLTTEFQNVEIPVTGGTSNGYLFYLNCSVPSKDYVVTVNDVAFYDADGNQIKDLPMTPND